MTQRWIEFKRALLHRSKENTESIKVLYEMGVFGPCVSLLRQELDSLIRVCYLNTLDEENEIDRLIDDTINGVIWTKNGKRITDKKMVNIASQYNLWAPEVYEFGNCFTHLSNYHDYYQNDPLLKLDPKKSQVIKHYLNSYHGFSLKSAVTFQNVIPYIPKVSSKVSNNLQLYIKDLNSRSK